MKQAESRHRFFRPRVIYILQHLPSLTGNFFCLYLFFFAFAHRVAYCIKDGRRLRVVRAPRSDPLTQLRFILRRNDSRYNTRTCKDTESRDIFSKSIPKFNTAKLIIWVWVRCFVKMAYSSSIPSFTKCAQRFRVERRRTCNDYTDNKIISKPI